MTTFAASDFAPSLLWSAVAVVVVLAATFAVAKIAGKHSVIDTAWGLLFAAITISTLVCSAGHGNNTRRIVLGVLTIGWGLRLAQHIGRRTIGKSEDPRYAALLAKAKGSENLYALRMIYLLQGLLAYLISAPVQVGAFEGPAMGILGWAGVAIWVVGVAFEATADRQLEAFRRDPARKGTIMQSGLWRYSRHPNYFGDACVWWGIFLVAAEHWPGLLTIAAPLIMTFLLTKGSGVRILDKHMSGRPGWSEYARRTSAFIPLPPKRVETSGDPGPADHA
jgi:steroid 5-alpha reductase family enzyme